MSPATNQSDLLPDHVGEPPPMALTHLPPPLLVRLLIPLPTLQLMKDTVATQDAPQAGKGALKVVVDDYGTACRGCDNLRRPLVEAA